MKKRRLIIITIMIIAMVLSGCGGKKVRQSLAAGSSMSSSTVAESSSQSAAVNTEDLSKRMASLGLKKPTRPGPVRTPDDQPVHLETHENVANSKLPKVEISLPDNYGLLKSDYTTAVITITNAGDNNLPASEGQIRIRGNSTAGADVDKKSFKIKFDKKQALFGRDPEKSWTLLANAFDLTGIHNYVSYGLYDKLTPEGTFSSICQFVDVYVNGAYQGVYNLCDQIETGKGRVPLKATIGDTPEQCDYLIEEDFRAPTEKPDRENLEWFWMDYTNDAFKIQSPEEKDGLAKEHTAYIKSYMENVYAAIVLKDWNAINSLIDVDSFIIGQSLAEITKNYDIFQASLFMYKKADGKLTFGPAWDFDTTFGSCPLGEEGLPEGSATEANPFFGGLMKVPEYREKYVAYFNSHVNEMVTYINSTIDNADAAFGENLEKDYQNWSAKFSYYGVPEMQKLKTHKEQTAFMKEWLSKRVEWLTKTYK